GDRLEDAVPPNRRGQFILRTGIVVPAWLGRVGPDSTHVNVESTGQAATPFEGSGRRGFSRPQGQRRRPAERSDGGRRGRGIRRSAARPRRRVRGRRPRPGGTWAGG